MLQKFIIITFLLHQYLYVKGFKKIDDINMLKYNI